MIYLSKGILARRTKGGAEVSHCGELHRLTGAPAALWLNGHHSPGHTHSGEQDIELRRLFELGIVETSNDTADTIVFRMLTGCVVCPVRGAALRGLYGKNERNLWRWLTGAGLKLTMAELVFLFEHNIEPVPALLGPENRQALTEVIYTAETIADGILESRMENSTAREQTVNSVLKLLRKNKIFLV